MGDVEPTLNMEILTKADALTGPVQEIWKSVLEYARDHKQESTFISRTLGMGRILVGLAG